jgi:hypothetical protein
MRFIALDPGGTTGIAEFNDQHHIGIVTSHLGPNPHHNALYDWLVQAQPGVVIYEAFDNRGIAGADLISREYIGVTRMFCQRNQISSHSQKAAAIKGGFWTDDRLATTALWKRMVHERDATVHLLVYLKRINHPYHRDLLIMLK